MWGLVYDLNLEAGLTIELFNSQSSPADSSSDSTLHLDAVGSDNSVEPSASTSPRVSPPMDGPCLRVRLDRFPVRSVNVSCAMDHSVLVDLLLDKAQGALEAADAMLRAGDYSTTVPLNDQ